MTTVGPGQEIVADFSVSGPSVLLGIESLVRDWVPLPIMIFYYGERQENRAPEKVK